MTEVEPRADGGVVTAGPHGEPLCTPLRCEDPTHFDYRHPGIRYPPGQTRWSCAQFLDHLREQGDEAADRCFRELEESGELGERDFAEVFRHLNWNDARLPEVCASCGRAKPVPDPMKKFFRTVDDQARTIVPPRLLSIERGQRVFWPYAVPALLVYLTRSLPEGYAAPPFAQILHFTKNLEDHTYRRLMGTLQMLVNVSTLHGFESRRLGIGRGDPHVRGKAISMAKQLRLLHAGVRYIARAAVAGWSPRFSTGPTGTLRHVELAALPSQLRELTTQQQVPVNREDLLATIIALSYLVIDSLWCLEVDLGEGEAEDFFTVWRTFAVLMGIHPPDDATSAEYVPANVAEAREFYKSYRRRHYVGVGTARPYEANEAGAALGRAHLHMMRTQLMPPLLRWLGIPRLYMTILIGPQGCRRVGVTPVPGHRALRWILVRLPAVWMRFVEGVRKRAGQARARVLRALKGEHATISRKRPAGLGTRPHGILTAADELEWAAVRRTQQPLVRPFVKSACTTIASLALGQVHENLARLLFRHLIRREYGNEVTFLVPDRLAELRQLVLGRRQIERRQWNRRAISQDIPFPDRRALPDRRSGDDRRARWRPPKLSTDELEDEHGSRER